MTEVELALLSAIKTLIVVATAKDPSITAGLTRLFASQRDDTLRRGLPDASLVFAALHDFVANPELREDADLARQLLAARPQGEA